MASIADKIRKYVGNDDIDFLKDVTLVKRHPDEEVEIVEWNITSHSKPTIEELDAFEEAADEYAQSIAYLDERVYPHIADQLDYIYHNGIAKWKSDMIKPVKDAHPKPE
jgi:hypothetical protein